MGGSKDTAEGSADLVYVAGGALAPSGGAALTDLSDTQTAGGASQQLAAAKANRRYLLIQNPSTAALQGIGSAEPLFVNFGVAATAGPPSIELQPGQSIVMEGSFVSTEEVTVLAATIGHAYLAKEA